MRAVLALILAVAMSACSSAESPRDATRTSVDGLSPAPSSPSSVSVTRPDQRWAALKKSIEEKKTGHLQLRVFLDGLGRPYQSQTGMYDLSNGALDLTVQQVTDRRDETTMARITPKGQGYLRMESWSGPWDGCWLAMDATALEVEPDTEGSDHSPALLDALFRVVADNAGPTEHEMEGHIDASIALHLFNVSSSALARMASKTRHVAVTVWLDVDAEAPSVNAQIDGDRIVQELDKGGVVLDEDVEAFLARANLQLDVSEVGRPVSVPTPDSNLVLPEGATKRQACPANR